MDMVITIFFVLITAPIFILLIAIITMKLFIMFLEFYREIKTELREK